MQSKTADFVPGNQSNLLFILYMAMDLSSDDNATSRIGIFVYQIR